jgi:NADH-quinone oxidoreductase subunit G
VPHLGRIDVVPENAWAPLARGSLPGGELRAVGGDHYLANPVMRASTVMAELSRLAAVRRAQPMAAE